MFVESACLGISVLAFSNVYWFCMSRNINASILQCFWGLHVEEQQCLHSPMFIGFAVYFLVKNAFAQTVVKEDPFMLITNK